MLKRNYLFILLTVLAGCASMLSSEPTKVDPTEQKYIEAETTLKNLYVTQQELAKAEKRARAAGAPVGTIVTKDVYDATLDRLDTFKDVLRDGRKLVAGSCLDVTKFKDIALTGCMSREQIALVLLTVLSRFNQGRL